MQFFLLNIFFTQFIFNEIMLGNKNKMSNDMGDSCLCLGFFTHDCIMDVYLYVRDCIDSSPFYRSSV